MKGYNEFSQEFLKQWMRTGHIIVNPHRIFDTMETVQPAGLHFYSNPKTQTKFGLIILRTLAIHSWYSNIRRIRRRCEIYPRGKVQTGPCLERDLLRVGLLPEPPSVNLTVPGADPNNQDLIEFYTKVRNFIASRSYDYPFFGENKSNPSQRPPNWMNQQC